MATWNSTSTDGTTSSKSSEKYNLDETDKRDILVYKYRGGLDNMSQEKLCKKLDKDPKWAGMRVSRKKIPRGNSRIEVKTEDLYNEPEKSAYQKFPNAKNSLASIGLPSVVYWKRLLLNEYQDLYIISPESSPSTTPESSQHVSPSSTFPKNNMGRKSTEEDRSSV
ncbi:hypothetical protein M501DRAFT_999862 [Patellaria atrata CBS 101060]|uniref:Uncharacterized protein n=1 Tax=Patellaria atrata CBS 101060 TaxID=1346257 RepID=A0A9P4VKT9_9PEZI|nr:hypothetical protein M501DRAFT_999862 [Patellaria atrata CBS 101060]